MSQHTFNDVFKKQQQRLVPATFKKAYISAVHTASNTVDIYYVENPSTVIKNVPVARSVSLTGVVAGTRCRVDLFIENSPNDAVVAYIF